jgi:hypothetical protein
VAHAILFLLPYVSVPNILHSNLRVNTPTGIFFKTGSQGEPSYSIRFVIPGAPPEPTCAKTKFIHSQASIKFCFNAPPRGLVARVVRPRAKAVFIRVSFHSTRHTCAARVENFVSPKKKPTGVASRGEPRWIFSSFGETIVPERYGGRLKIRLLTRHLQTR